MPRGETPLTAAISTAEDLADLMAFAAQRRKNMTAMATFLKQQGTPIDAAPAIMGDTDTKRSNLSKWVQNLFLRPGDTVLLPPGIEAKMEAPTGDMPGRDTTVKIETMVICAIIGVPYH